MSGWGDMFLLSSMQLFWSGNGSHHALSRLQRNSLRASSWSLTAPVKLTAGEQQQGIIQEPAAAATAAVSVYAGALLQQTARQCGRRSCSSDPAAAVGTPPSKTACCCGDMRMRLLSTARCTDASVSISRWYRARHSCLDRSCRPPPPAPGHRCPHPPAPSVRAPCCGNAARPFSWAAAAACRRLPINVKFPRAALAWRHSVTGKTALPSCVGGAGRAWAGAPGRPRRPGRGWRDGAGAAARWRRAARPRGRGGWALRPPLH